MSKIEDKHGVVIERKESLLTDETGENFIGYKLVFVVAMGTDEEPVDEVENTLITVRTQDKKFFDSFETLKKYKMSFALKDAELVGPQKMVKQ